MTENTENCWFCKSPAETGCAAFISLDKKLGRTADDPSLADEEGIRYDDFEVSDARFTVSGVKQEMVWYRYAISEISIPRCGSCESAHRRYKKILLAARIFCCLLTALIILKLYADSAYPGGNSLENIVFLGFGGLIGGSIIIAVLFFIRIFDFVCDLILKLVGVNNLDRARKYPPVRERLNDGFWINRQASS